MNKITFYQRFESDILADRKIITLRNESESDVIAGQRLPVHIHEDDRWICNVLVIAVKPIEFDALSDKEAYQEHMALPELKQLIQEIYPGIRQLHKIWFQRCRH